MRASSNSNSILIALGNQLKGDDAIAIEVCKILQKNFEVFFAFTSPDAFIGKIKKKKPKSVFFVDAAVFNGPFGKVKLLGKLKNFESSSHAVDLGLIKKLLSPINVYFLGINIRKTDYSDELSDELKKKIPEIASKVEKLVRRIAND